MSQTIYTGDTPKPEITEADSEIVARWDKSMKRAFKGLVMGGRPTARAMLLRTQEARDA